jgi:tRNA(Ile)-lysidine synthase
LHRAEQAEYLDLTVLRDYNPEQQRRVIRRWLAQRGLKMPSEAVLQALFTQVIAAEAQRDPVLQWQGVTFRRYRERLYCLESAALAVSLPSTPIVWPKGSSSLTLNAEQCLHIHPASAGIDRQLWDKGVVTVQRRLGGEKIRLPGRAGMHCLKKLFQEAGIAPWLREQMPLLYIGGELAAVGELWVSAHVWSTDADRALRLTWQQSASTGYTTAPHSSASF